MPDIAAVTRVQITAKDDTADGFRTATQSLNSFAATAGAVGAAAGEALKVVYEQIKKVAEFVPARAEAVNQLRILALEAGTTVEKFQLLATIGEETGLGQETLAKQLSKVNEALALAQDSTSKQAYVLRALGVDSKDAADATLQALKAISQFKDEQSKIAALTDLFNAKEARALLPVLDEIIAKQEHAQQVIEQTGAKPTQDLIDKSKEYKSAITDLGLAWQGVANVILSAVLPQIITGINKTAEWLQSLKGYIDKFNQLNQQSLNRLESVAKGGNVGTTPHASTLDSFADPALDQQRAVEFSKEQARLAGLATSYKAFAVAASGAIKTVEDEYAKLLDSLGLAGVKLQADLDSLNTYGTKVGESSQAVTAFALAHGKLGAELTAIALVAPTAAAGMEFLALSTAKANDETAREVKATEDVLAARKRDADSIAREVEGLQQQAKAGKDATDTFGLLGSQVEAYRAHQAELTIQTINQDNPAGKEAAATLELIAQAHRDLSNELAKQEALRQQVADFQTLIDVGRNAFQSIGDKASDIFKKIGADMKKYLLDALYDMTFKKWIINIATVVTGGGGSGVASALTNAGGGGNPFNLLGSIFGGSGGAGGIGSLFAGGGIDLAPELGALGPLLGIAGAALPVAAIGGLLLQSFLSSKSGGPKSGGSAIAGTSAGFTALDPAAGTRFFTPSDADAQLQTQASDLLTSYKTILTQIGGTGNASFALGFDTDPRGKASDRVAGAVTINGQQVFAQGLETGRDSAATQAALALEAQRSLVAALKSSNLPDEFAKLFKDINPATATQDQIDTVLKLVDAHVQLDAALKAQVDAINKIKEAVAASIADTKRTLTLATLDSEGQYNFLLQEANRLRGQINTATSGDQVQALTQQITQDVQQAFGLLDQSGKQTNLQPFFDYLDQVNTEANARLTSLTDQLSVNSDDLVTRIGSVMSDAATSFISAANSMGAAADTMQRAASTPVQVVVQSLNGPGGQTNFG